MPRLPAKLRVVFTGHAGLAKGRVLRRLCQYIYSQDPTWRESSPAERQQREKELAQVYEAEVRLRPMAGFLEMEWRAQHLAWRRSLDTALSQLEAQNPPPRCAFLSLHVTYQWHSGFFSPLPWRINVARSTKGYALENTLTDFIRDRFCPNYCVTLIDDIHAVQDRIAPGISIRLRELLTWRNLEIHLTDFLARETVVAQNNPGLDYDPAEFPFFRSPVVAIRHPPEMLYRLLTEPNGPHIYTSYPITSTRVAHRDEIDRFRYTMHRHFTVFDPVTIDERPLQNILQAYRTSNPTEPAWGRMLALQMEDRWPISADRTLCEEPPKVFNNIRADELYEVAYPGEGSKSEIDRMIEARDFRLIDQSDCVVVYRPYFRSHTLSGGTKAEVEYAKRTQKPVFLIHDPINDGALDPLIFGPEFIGGPYRYDRVGDLGDTETQSKILGEVTDIIKTKSAELVRRRLPDS